VRTFDDAKVLPLARRANVFGALDMGLAPNLLPGRVSVTSAGPLTDSWGDLPTAPGRSTRHMLDGSLQALILMGSDPVVDVPDGPGAREALAAADFVVSIDLFHNASNATADVILPADGFAEKDGTVTNIEGRVQKVHAVTTGHGQSRPDWSILDDLSSRMGIPMGFASAEAIAKEIAEVAPAYRGVTWDLLDWDERDGVVVPYGDAVQPLAYLPADTPGEIVKGDLVLHSARTMYDDGVLMRNGLSLHSLAPGAALHVHPDDASRLGLNGEASITAGEVSAVLPVIHDPSLARGTVYVPFNQPGGPVLGPDLVVEVAPA
jgi:predicted molibdopterin-dependent oxidoreductase YjgC